MVYNLIGDLNHKSVTVEVNQSDSLIVTKSFRNILLDGVKLQLFFFNMKTSS